MNNEVNNGQNLSIAALVLGILGIVGGFIPVVCYFTTICAILGIILGVKGRQMSVAATGSASGLATAGLVLGTSLFLPQAKATGLGVDTDPFEEIVSELVKEAAGLVGQPVPTDMDSRFRMIYHVGAGYAIPNAEDTPYIEELARQEGILLDPVYTGKAWAKFLMLVKEGYFDGQEHIAFVHTGGAAALFAMDLG